MNLSPEDIVSVRKKYKRMLELPHKDTSGRCQFFLCPVGLVGAGKTTIIKPLSKRLSLVRVSSDDIRQILNERNVGYEQLMDILKPLVTELAMQGYSLSFDADCGNPKTREMIMQLAEKVHAKVFWIHIDPPEDFILNKLRNYDHTWLFKNADEAIKNYFQQKDRRKQENTRFDFLTTIDTSRADLSAQIEHVIESIEKHTLYSLT